ncbi:MAG TPA: polysaccharide biosynthesis tyrosine autokinase [Pseudosphingobacterium sp.]|nr:polysaccharide biosynthesis tyrosine autokinase [Pseudosphingobacterium sp.]
MVKESVASVPNSKQNLYVDFGAFLGKFLKLWPLLLLSIVFFGILSWGYLRYFAIPKYHISAKVLIDDQNQNKSPSATQLDLSTLLGTTSNVDNQVEILRTRSLMESLVRDLNLNIVYYYSGKFKDTELFSSPVNLVVSENDLVDKTLLLDITPQNENEFLLEYIDRDQGLIKLGKFAFGKIVKIANYGAFLITRNDAVELSRNQKYKIKIASVDNTVSELRSMLSAVIANKLTTVIDLQIDYPLRDKGEYILSNYIDEYIRQNIQDKSRIADSTISFIDKRIVLVNGELNEIESDIQKFMQDKGLANIAAQSQLLLESGEGYTKELLNVETRIQMLEAVYKMLSQPGSTTLISGSVVSGEGTNDQAFSNLLSSYNGLVLERERLRMGYTKENPYILNIDTRIDSVKGNIFNYIQNTKKSLEVSKGRLSLSTGAIKGNIRKVPAQERAFLDLSRQQQLKQDLYLFLLQKREETAVANTSNIAGIRVIDKPKADKMPFSPKTTLIWLGAVMLAVFVPFSKIYIHDVFNKTIDDRQDVESKTALPVISELQHNNSGNELVEFESSRSPLAEQFRGLRTNVQFLLSGANDKVILLTSGMPGEGKSFVSLNLANVFAISGTKVLLLEFDLRRPKLSKTYGKNRVGISNYIIDRSLTLSDIVTPVNNSNNLYFASSGPIPPNPSELILSGRTKQFFLEAKENFDLIIIDAPPIGAVTDGQLLSKFSDIALYVLRVNYTPKSLIQLANDVLSEGKIKRLNIVLNDVPDSNSSGYGAGKYGYAYGYYDQGEGKKSLRKFWKK